MSIAIMIAGQLAKPPEQRISKNGNPYTTATVRTQEGDDALFASVTAFGDLGPILAGLAKGDPITVVGSGKVSTYQGKDGDTRAGLSITASRIIALTDHQAPPKAPRSKGNGQRRRIADAQAGPPDLPPIEAYNDSIPF